MKKNKNLIETFESELSGQKVTVNRFKPKGPKKVRNKPRNTAICPECASVLKVNEHGVWECTGDKLKIWENHFLKYHKLNDQKKAEFLTHISDYGKFEFLYGRWETYLESDDKTFDCGYTNELYPHHANSKIRLPDPVFCKMLEKKLNRKLTEEELCGEEPIYFYQGKFYDEFDEKFKKIKIPIITFPDDV